MAALETVGEAEDLQEAVQKIAKKSGRSQQEFVKLPEWGHGSW